jgi:Family of unknown function (DUF6152)
MYSRTARSLILLCLPCPALAHHSVSAIFDTGKVVETNGEITGVSWRNPHASFQLEVKDKGGTTKVWTVELTSLTNLRRAGVEGQLIRVGDQVRVAGNPARSSPNRLYAENILLADGEEVVLESRAKPRWSSRVLGRGGPSGPGDASAPELGIFRVWSTPRDEPLLLLEDVEPVFNYDRYPLTAAARSAVEHFDRINDSPILNCVPKGMPTAMEQPYPMEFVRRGDDIVMRLEEYDASRVIHMAPGATDDNQPASNLGHSVGRWEGDSLAVKTTRTTWPYFDVVGIPLSKHSEMLERFTPSKDGSRLDYTLTVTDSTTFTKPVTLSKFWVWYPQMKVEPYKCKK